jgi:fibronectin-binding autotransporter adhesin
MVGSAQGATWKVDTRYVVTRTRPITRCLLLLAFAAVAFGVLPGVAAAADRAFAPRFQTHTRGNFAFAANALMTCPTATAGCPAARAGTGTATQNNDDNWTMGFIDADADATTTDSSSATLTVPAGATVAWAGLYWGGDSAAASRGTMSLKSPGAAGYTAVTSTQTDTSTSNPTRYQGFADVTAQVAAGGTGSYWGANVQSTTGTNRYAGWSLVVAYRLASDPVRNLSVFDGLVSVASGSTSTVPFTGFQSPASGTVNAKLGLISWEGDLGITGDAATLNGTVLTDAQNPGNNVFNSSISDGGTRITSKNPDYVNQLGMDANSLTVNGMIANNATTATLGVSTTGDTYHLGVASLAIDQIPELPSNTGAPTLSGTAKDGQTLTATAGTWTGTTTISTGFQWQRCDSAGANCSNIAGATGSTYTLTPSDVGSTVKAVVTATNTEGTGTASTPTSATVAAIAPANTVLPVISGTTTDGQTLSTSTGTFSGSAPFVYSYQWRRCDSAGLVCADIAGATGATYALTSTDVAKTIRVVVTATNGGGSAPATSAQTAVIAPLAPANSALPSVSGTARDGQALTAATGSWTGSTPITYTYQWQRCNAAGASCANIGGQTASTYSLVPADVGNTARVVVTATNAAGSASANSAVTGTVAALAPSNTSVPTLSGTARDGSTLTAANGSWTGTPTISYSYQWQRCNAAGASCADIAGQTASTYSLVPADVGNTARVVVTATNAAGSASANSAVTGAVAALAPTNSALPTISGTARDGSSLSAGNGSWTGTPTITYGYQWRRCDAAGLLCVDIASATASTYNLVAADIGATIRVVVTATNGGGSAPATSAQTAVVAALAPANTSAPTLSGTARAARTSAARPLRPTRWWLPTSARPCAWS